MSQGPPDEAAYHDLVAAWLDDTFNDIEHEKTLASGKRPDFIAHTPFESYVIEVEDSTVSLYNGIGQAAVYAAETGHTPVLVLPADDAPTESLPDWLHVETV